MSSLPLFPSKAPKVSQRDVAWMLQKLRGRGWVKAWLLSTPAEPISERKLRAIAAESEGQIISGQQGYRLTREASVEDVNHAAAWLERQGKAMQRRAQEIRKAMHQRPAEERQIAS